MADGHKGRTLQADATTEEEVNHFSDEPTACRARLGRVRGRPQTTEIIICGRPQTTEIIILYNRQTQGKIEFTADGHKGRTLQADATTEEEVNHFSDEPTACRARLGRVRGRPQTTEIIICGRPQTTEIIILYNRQTQGKIEFTADGHKGRTLQAGVTNEEEVNHFSDESTIYRVYAPRRSGTTSCAIGSFSQAQSSYKERITMKIM